MIGQLEDSVRFGKLALAMRDRVNHQESAARTTTIAYSMILHLKTSFRDLVGPFSQAFEAGLSIGNRGIAMLAAAMHSATLFNTGMNLERISNDMDALQSRVHSHGNPTDALTSMLLPYWQASLNLMGASAHPIILSGEAMQEETVVNEARETKNMLLLNLLFAAKIQVACYYGYWDIARGLYKEREMEATKFIKMNMVSFVLEFLGGLICFELHRKTGKRKYLKEGKVTWMP